MDGNIGNNVAIIARVPNLTPIPTPVFSPELDVAALCEAVPEFVEAWIVVVEETSELDEGVLCEAVEVVVEAEFLMSEDEDDVKSFPLIAVTVATGIPRRPMGNKGSLSLQQLPLPSLSQQ